MRASVKLVPMAIVAVLLVPLAGAQTQPVLAITPATSEVSLADGQTQHLAWTVQNNGRTEATVQVGLQVPPGWEAQLTAGDGSFALAAGASRALQASVSPAEQVSDGTLVLEATAENAVGQSASFTATTSLVYLPPPPVPPPPPSPWPAVAAAAAAVLVLLAGVYWFLATRVVLRLAELDASAAPGDRASYTLQVENRARRAQKIRLRLRGLGPPWAGALMVPHVLLDGLASTEVPISVRIPDDAVAGTVRPFTVQASPAGPFPWLVSRRVQARVREDLPPRSLRPAPPAAPLPAT